MLESFGERLKVISPTKTRVLAVEFTSRSLDLAARSPEFGEPQAGAAPAAISSSLATTTLGLVSSELLKASNQSFT